MLCAGINWGYMPASVRGLVRRSCFVCEKGRTFFLLVLVVFVFLIVVPSRLFACALRLVSPDESLRLIACLDKPWT